MWFISGDVYPSVDPIPGNRAGPARSREKYIQMVNMIQENGAAGLRSFELQVKSFWQEGCKAMRVGWLDVLRQPTLRSEGRFDIRGSSSECDVPIST